MAAVRALKRVADKLPQPRLCSGRAALIFMMIVVVALLAVFPDEAFAGPGGQIAKAAYKGLFKTTLGRIIGGVLLGIVVIVLLPLFMYVVVREWIGVKRTKADLARLAERYPYFEWQRIERRLERMVEQVYAAWKTGDLSGVASKMNEEFYYSQQAILDRWKEEGKRNYVRLEKLCNLAPVLVYVANEMSESSLRVRVRIDVVDYLERIADSEVLKGKKEVNHGYETIWWLAFVGGKWLLHGIEEGTDSLTLASTPNQVDTSHLDRRARRRQRRAAEQAPFGSDQAAAEAAQHQSAEDMKESEIEIPRHDQEDR